MTDHGFRRVLMRGGSEKKDGCGTLHVKDVTKFLQKQVECRQKEDIMFRLERGKALSRAASPRMTTEYS